MHVGSQPWELPGLTLKLAPILGGQRDQRKRLVHGGFNKQGIYLQGWSWVTTDKEQWAQYTFKDMRGGEEPLIAQV